MEYHAVVSDALAWDLVRSPTERTLSKRIVDLGLSLALIVVCGANRYFSDEIE
jgi:hypothetical protein